MANTTVQNNTRKVKQTDIKDVLLKYLIYLPLVAICLVISFSIVYLKLRYEVPTYNSTINLLIKDIKKSTSLTDQVLGELSSGSSNNRVDLVNQMEILKSTSLMTRVVERLQLNLTSQRVGKIKTTEIYNDNTIQLQFDTIFNNEKPFDFIIGFVNKNQFYVGEKSNGKLYASGHQFTNETGKFRIVVNFPRLVDFENKYRFKYQSVWSTAGSLAGALTINALKFSSIFYIGINTEQTAKGRDILNHLVTAYNEQNIEDQNKIVDNSIAFIDERLRLLTSELGNVEEKLADFNKRNEVVGLEQRSSFEFSEANGYQKMVEDSRLQLEIIDMIRQYVANPDKRNQLVPSNLGIGDATLASMIAQYNTEILQREQLLKTVPESNPSVQVINNQAERLRQNIIEALANLRKSTQNVINFNQGRYNAATSKLSSIPDKQLMFREISRQQGIKEQLYLFLLQKREESAITKASAIGGAISIDPAKSGGAPVSPNKGSMYRLAFILGLGIPVGLIYLKELLNNKIMTRQQVANATDCPLLGEISHDKEKERQFVVSNNNRKLIAEQFRILRTNVQFLVGDKSNPIIMVTSSVSGEGKTFTSMNMAAVFALSGKKTVLIEMDLRKPKITSSLQLGQVKGITHYILGNATLDDIIQPINEIPGLSIVPAGIIPPNPAELILDPKIQQLLNQLKSRFDLVVIDMAPIGLVSDAKVIGQFADASIYIIRQRYTLLRQLNMINDMYVNSVLPNMGIVSNDVLLKGASSYYGYYGYGYGYGYNNGYGYTYNYGYGSGEDKKPAGGRIKSFFTRKASKKI